MAMYAFIIMGAFLGLVLGQNVQLDSPPQDVDDLRLNVHNLEDFMSLLTVNGRPLRDDDIFSPYETEDGKRVITGGGVMATSDECSPRNMSVRLPLNYTDPQVAFYPECTMVQRCGGCCPTQFLSCEPAYKEKIVLKVLRARYLYPGAVSMQWEGFESVEVERHMTCRAVCRLTLEECGSNRRFLPNQCKCQCLQTTHCYHHQRWDPETCTCRCIHTTDCCGQQEDTRCPFFFNHATCECTAKSMIGAHPNASQAEIEAWLAANSNGLGSAARAPEPTSPTTTTTTTTTTAPTPEPETQEEEDNGCGPSPCPRNFVWRMNSRGRCVCQLSSRNRYPGRG